MSGEPASPLLCCSLSLTGFLSSSGKGAHKERGKDIFMVKIRSNEGRKGNGICNFTTRELIGLKI